MADITLQELRSQVPAYSNMRDAELAWALYTKIYQPAGVPMGMYADQIGLSREDFNEMLQIARSSGYEPTGQAYAEGYVPPSAVPLTFARGASLGAFENIAAATAAGAEKGLGILGDVRRKGMESGYSFAQNMFPGMQRMPEMPAVAEGENGRSIGQAYQDYLSRLQRPVEQFYKEDFGKALATEIAGGLATGSETANLLRQGSARIPGALGRFAGRPIVQAPVGAGVGGLIYGTATSGGDIEQRLEKGKEAILPSMFFGAGLQGIANVASPAIRKLGFTFDVASRRPTIDTLQRAKSAAYKLVEDSGLLIPAQRIQKLLNDARSVLNFDTSYLPETSPNTEGSMKLIGALVDKDITLSQLDQLRKGISRQYKKDMEEVQNLDLINLIDDLIDELDDGSELMTAARTANSRFKKAELIDMAFDKAETSAASTGTGGNIQNRYKQVIRNILTNQRQIKFFTQEEQRVMRDMIEGDLLENVMRLVGKLDPSSGGLMLSLNVGAAIADPTYLLAGATGSVARAGAEQSTMDRALRVFETAASGQTQPLPSTIVSPTISGGAAQNATSEAIRGSGIFPKETSLSDWSAQWFSNLFGNNRNSTVNAQ